MHLCYNNHARNRLNDQEQVVSPNRPDVDAPMGGAPPGFPNAFCQQNNLIQQVGR